MLKKICVELTKIWIFVGAFKNGVRGLFCSYIAMAHYQELSIQHRMHTHSLPLD
jgi:hypothetical protein